ncbi:MAG: hypothetical protein ABI467_04560 [Kofleriaceae bacterium]
MRTSTILLASLLATSALLGGCKKDDAATGDDGVDSGMGSGSGTDPGAAFTVQSTDVTIPSGTGNEVTYCYWFKTPNTTALAINKWVSDMAPGSHHMIFFAGGSFPPDLPNGGLDTQNRCGLGTSSGTNQPAWVFASQTLHLEEDLPADDGTGKPLAQVIEPGTVGAIQMHYLNATDSALTAHVKLSAYALADGATYTRTDPYITYNYDISIGPNATGVQATASCPTPAGAKFWTMSTHSHKQSVETQISDTNGMILDSHDWEHPTVKTWDSMPFYTVNGNLTWTCTYDNTGDNKGSTVVQGASAATNEMCMATGYFFPSTKAQFCVSGHAFNGCYCL